MGGNLFDQIALLLEQQKLLKEELEAENRELRRQLEDLRAGRGIVVEICGTYFPLQETIGENAPAMMAAEVVSENVQAQQRESVAVSDAPTAAIPVAVNGTGEEANISPEQIQVAENEQLTGAPGFLEEMMLDEFAASLTNPMAVWSGPDQQSERQRGPQEIDEEQKAILRRELMGSFILE